MTQLIRRIVGAALLGSVAIASAQVNSGSDGSDGAFNPTATDTTVNLALATPTAWNLPGGGNGVYDATKWAVVFKYSSVNIAAGRTVRFTNHPKNPPVVWLVQGDVTISGTVILDAAAPTTNGLLTVPGPGGFRGASNDYPVSLTRGAGFGPGGSSNVNGYSGEGGSYGSQPSAGNQAGMGPVYGNAQILPLIGGSGSKTFSGIDRGAGAGGGAILIVASGTITVNGAIQANGSSIHPWANWENCGSGGAIRLVANQIIGSGILRANAPFASGGAGRIRLERLSSNSSFGGTLSPAASTAVLAGPTPTIWPTETHPSLKVLTVDGVAVPDDPASNFVTPDLQVGPAANSIIRLEAKNIPTDGTWRVQVRIVPRSGPDQFATATLITPGTTSIWEASVVLPPGGSAVIARAYKL